MDLTQAGWAWLLLRWLHIAAGITWIGLLYYFNFAQAPFMNAAEANVKSAVNRGLVPRVLLWFRWSALVTWLAGITLILIRINEAGSFEILGTTYGTLILSGMLLGTLMFLNVWGVIWPNAKQVIASAEAAASGGQANPATADLQRRAFLASRTNVLFSIPMLFFMAAAAHGPLLGRTLDGGDRTVYWLIAGALMAILQANALSGLTGASKKPLETIGSVITSGLVLYVLLLATLLVLSTG